MAYRTLMVFINSEDEAPALLQVATAMARQHSAHLIGVYVKPPLQVYAHAEVAVYLMDDHNDYHDKQSVQLEKLFQVKTKNETFVSEWRYLSSATMSTPDAIAEVARTADLLIVSQKNSDEKNQARREASELVISTASRPVVIVPCGKEIQSVGTNVYVAWDGGAAATRAVFDALPALQKAENVTLHRINPARADRHRILGTSAELVTTLSRHNVKTELIESDAMTSEIGEEILTYTRERGADLLVMGAYGHSRIREYIFGGVTRYALDNMFLPVLMSH